MMSKRLLTILLFISLAFNLAVLGSVFWLHTRIPKPPHPRHENFQRPRLPEHLQDLPWDPQLKELRKDYDRDRIQLLRELAKAEYQEATALALIDSSLAAQNKLEIMLANRLLTLRTQMSAEEAEEYFRTRADHIEKRSDRFRKMHERRNTNEENNRNRPYPRDGYRDPARPETR